MASLTVQFDSPFLSSVGTSASVTGSGTAVSMAVQKQKVNVVSSWGFTNTADWLIFGCNWFQSVVCTMQKQHHLTILELAQYAQVPTDND